MDLGNFIHYGSWMLQAGVVLFVIAGVCRVIFQKSPKKPTPPKTKKIYDWEVSREWGHAARCTRCGWGFYCEPSRWVPVHHPNSNPAVCKGCGATHRWVSTTARVWKKSNIKRWQWYGEDAPYSVEVIEDAANDPLSAAKIAADLETDPAKLKRVMELINCEPPMDKSATQAVLDSNQKP